jgi:flagellar protein FliS
MQKELKQDFTRRLSQCNRGEMIVIIYDIYFAYTDDAKMAYEQGLHEAYKGAIHKAQSVLNELMRSLDYSYQLSKELKQLYTYSRDCLSRALYENKLDGITDAERVMRGLYSSFEEVAKLDDSEPLMQNTQQVYAGMTYGRKSLTEILAQDDKNRGYLA